ncbi:MAG TPA: cyclic nucleotide-binding domain-containing protein [Thiotrichaceae bacterium]|jgi:CRP-like cAMP-binding protein|nr:cyclic nucleotide-binding domain-containing protein [Thiotrichaceae bacterium]HIM07938.1 cyclic nucleotide-binding domain-containing protein [Gammaproteobacteria bacterium]
MTVNNINPSHLGKVPIFSNLSDAELQEIINSPDNGYEEYEMKQGIIREEEIGDCMYIILEGTVDVSIRSGGGSREISIATLRAGDFFGEQSLLPGSDGRRNASVRAMHPSKLFRIDKKHVLLHIDGIDESEDVTMVPKFKTEEQEVRDMLGNLRLFQSLASFELDSYRNWTEVITVGPGDFIVKESEHGEHLYVILDGIVEVFIIDEDGKINILARLKPGEYFGEQALMEGNNSERNAYARTDNETRLIKIAKDYFKLALKRDSVLAEALTKVGESQKLQS